MRNEIVLGPSSSFVDTQDSSGTSIFLALLMMVGVSEGVPEETETLRFERSENRSAARLGIEPRLMDSESIFLPLEDLAKYFNLISFLSKNPGLLIK